MAGSGDVRFGFGISGSGDARTDAEGGTSHALSVDGAGDAVVRARGHVAFHVTDRGLGRIERSTTPQERAAARAAAALDALVPGMEA